ncbi:acetyl xylan esterase [Opitutaceae bacterium TAV5]|nr:acetyl xylan esterase [Opitutaceae bacterium TAV5]
MSIISQFSRPAYENTGRDHGLRPVIPTETRTTAAETWERALRPALRREWLARLGAPSYSRGDYDPAAERISEQEEPEFRLEVYRQPTGPGMAQIVIVLHPRFPAGGGAGPNPCAVVPFYHAERSAGFVVGGARRGGRLERDADLREVVPLGLHLVRLGLTVACVEAFPFNTVEAPPAAELEADPFAWWRAAAARLRRDQPAWTGLGRLVHDTSRAVDLLLAQPGIDSARVLATGHSLGGKMAFFTGALDERIGAVIGSDFGLPWRSTNWHEPWYLGDRVPADDHGPALHEVLALLAPRPFFLVAGETDNRESWQYLEAARPVYALSGAGERIGCIDHSSGHAPPVAALEVAYAWLGEIFGLPARRWRA